jgi:glycosyltransferase involved in cell wall biosynthesis
MTLRLLLVSVEAPPSNNAEALQVGKILQALRQQPDLAVDVVTAETPAGENSDLATLLQADQGATHPSMVVQLPCRLSRWQRIALRLIAPWLAHRPDWSFLFTWRWRQVPRQLRHAPQLIYSRSFPPSSTLVGYQLARHYRVPWFLHLSDPWCESSLERHWNQSRWHLRQERRCLQAAQRISFTSPVTLQRYQQRYPELAGRMVLDPNVYTVSTLQPTPWQPDRRFRVVHTGSFTAERPVDALLDGLRRIPAHHPLFEDLELLQAGHSTPQSRALIRQAGPWFRDLGLVDAAGALHLQRQADLLLAIDWRFTAAADSQYLLSKLTDYLAIRRPVLVITHPEGASGRFVAAQNLGRAVPHADPDAIAAALIAYWQAWKAGDRRCFDLPRPDPTYSATAVAERIAQAARSSIQQAYAAPA